MKPGVHVVEIRDEAGNLKRKAVDAGCLVVLQKVGQVWLARGLWFLAGMVVGIIGWGN